MTMYDEGNIGIAIRSGFVETHAGNLHVYEDRTQVGNIVFITTDNFKKYISIEWLKKFANERALNDGMDCYWHFWGEDLLQMIEQWEKENEPY